MDDSFSQMEAGAVTRRWGAFSKPGAVVWWPGRRRAL
jgi:hypothetical protein